MQNPTKKTYLDYAATTPVDKRVVRVMQPYFTDKFGNTASLHFFGQEVQEALDRSRKKIVGFLNVSPEEIIFTSSATESNNMVIKGVASSYKKKGNHILVSSIEHECVLESARWLSKQGFTIELIPVDRDGLVDPKTVEKMIKKGTILVSVMHANNEIGTVQPIEEIGKICYKKNVLFHTDASQTFGKIPIDLGNLPVDFLTASAHKIYGPKGAALLYIKKGIKIEPLLHGGGHEHGLRSSTINLAVIIGFTKAADLCFSEITKEPARQAKLRDYLISHVLEKIPDSFLNGHPQKRLANNVNLGFKYIEGESIVMELDSFGIAVSTGSACASSDLKPSHVLLAIGLLPQEAHGSIRVSLGRFTQKKDIDYILQVLPKVVKKLRKISPYKSFAL